MLLEASIGRLAGVVSWLMEAESDEDRRMAKMTIKAIFDAMPEHYFDASGGATMEVNELLDHIGWKDEANKGG